jgi:hypothetical protein
VPSGGKLRTRQMLCSDNYRFLQSSIFCLSIFSRFETTDVQSVVFSLTSIVTDSSLN